MYTIAFVSSHSHIIYSQVYIHIYTDYMSYDLHQVIDTQFYTIQNKPKGNIDVIIIMMHILF